MSIRTRELILTAAVLLVISGWAVAQAGDKSAAKAPPQESLRWGIVGSSSCESKPCYSSIMSSPVVQQLLLDLANAPRDKSAVEATLKHSEVSSADLLRFGLIREHEDQYVLNFPLFTAQDLRTIQKVTDRYATSLAAAILLHRPEIESELRSYNAPGVDRKAVAFFILGCASLDWDGLTITADKGYRLSGRPRPDGTYVPYAEERSEVSAERVYRGSHNHAQHGIHFTSFGDDAGRPRFMLPDLAWGLPDRIAAKKYPSDFQAALQALLSTSLDRTITALGRITLALHDREMSSEALSRRLALSVDDVNQLLQVLVAIDYVAQANGQYRLKIPVLTGSDEAMTRRLLAIGHDQMVSWLAANYDNLKRDLRDLSFVRAGIPFEDGFTMIWHHVFGRANQRLVEAGLFADPYEQRYPGAIPVVFDLDLE